MSNKDIHNVIYLKNWRRDLRNNSTCAEVALWKLLKGKQLHGRKFRRQHSIENYIVDFFCYSENLIVELDGAGHFKTEGIIADYNRDARLKELGYRTIRIENKYVFSNPAGVLEVIGGCFGGDGGTSPGPSLEEGNK